MIVNKLPKQNGLVIWLCGLSGAGKSTIAALLEKKLSEKKMFCIRLDGDVLREGININLGFTDEDRAENIRRTAEMAKLLCENNVITICSLITPLNSHRAIASNILKEKYFEVFVDCPFEICANRDVKGLYKKASQHQIKNFTGVDSSFERPEQSGMVLSTSSSTAETCAMELLDQILYRVSNSEVQVSESTTQSGFDR